MKKLTLVSLFIFWAIVVAILVAGLVFYQKKGSSAPAIRQVNLLPQNGSPITLSMTEISKHNSSSDCWMIIDKKVYNLTSYLYQHPGGGGAMTPYCGQDGTTAFNTKDRSSARSHSGFATSLLSDFYIGDLNQTISPSQITPPIPSGEIPFGGEENDFLKKD